MEVLSRISDKQLLTKARFDRWYKAFTEMNPDDRFNEAKVWLKSGQAILNEMES